MITANATKIDREILKPLCGESLSIYQPFGFDGWDCATNGHALLMLRGETLKRAELPIGAMVELANSNQSHRETSLNALRGWARGAGPLHPRCEVCETPSEWSSTITGYIGPIRLNVALLSSYLPDELPGALVTVSWGKKLSPLLIRAPNWQLILMPLNPEPEGHRYKFSEPEAAR